MKKTFKEHLNAKNGRKRILSLDGGGIRGAFTCGLLKRLETLIQKKHPGYLLCDYFDLIGGTSTGAIIAAGLAKGMTVDEITAAYIDLGGKIFGKKKDWWNPLETWSFLKAQYDYSVLEENLKKVFGDMKLGSKKLKTGLCLVTKRADTNSTWPFINHPDGKYFPKNKHIPIWQIVRASSAAPTYFAPQLIDVGRGEQAAFIDGGVSMANNPALTLLMVATLKGFPFKWPLNENKISLVSLGTGYGVYKKQTGTIKKAWIKTWAQNVPNMLMQDASWQNQIILQWLSKSPTSVTIDREMGNLKTDLIGGNPHINYLRYDFPFTENDLNGLNLGIEVSQKKVENLLEMSNAHNRKLLLKIGTQASKMIKPAHLKNI